MESSASPRTVRSIATQAARDTGYLGLGLLTSVVAGCVWMTALSITISLVVFVIGLPLIVGCAILFRWAAELDRRNTAWFVRRPVRARYREPGSCFMALLGTALRDPQTWRDLVWLLLHSVVGFVFGCIAIGLLLLVAGIATLPAWSWSLPNGADVGLWDADTLLESFALALLAIPMAVVTVLAVRGMAIAESRLAESLLGGDDGRVSASATAPQAGGATRAPRFDPEVTLSLHIAFTALVAVLMTVIWVGSGFGYFWPAWVWIGIGLPLAPHFVYLPARPAPAERRRRRAVDGPARGGV